MKMRYCPQCASIDLINSLGGERCRRCGYTGPVREGAPNEINAFKLSLKGSSQKTLVNIGPQNTPKPNTSSQAADSPLKERLKKKSELEDIGDVEFL